MTINGGQPHRVGYNGQKYQIVVDCEDNGIQIIAWTNKLAPDDVLRSLETRPGWSNARNELVEQDWPLD